MTSSIEDFFTFSGSDPSAFVNASLPTDYYAGYDGIPDLTFSDAPYYYGSYGAADAPPMGGALYGNPFSAPGSSTSPPPGYGWNPSPQTPPWQGAIAGALGPLAGLFGNLFGGGITGSTRPQMTTQQKALQGQGTQALGLLSPFAGGTSPLQQAQAGILNPLSQYIQQLLGGGGAGTQGLINTLSPLIQQAYSPFAQGLMQQATEAGRRSGFYDAPGTSPPGGAILGPGLAALQGQQAQSLLQAMLQQIPQAAVSGAGAFNQPVNQQIGAASNMATGFGNLMGPVGTQTAVPQGSQIGQNIATAIGGAAQGYLGQQQANQQQQYRNSILNMAQNQGIGGASGLPWWMVGS